VQLRSARDQGQLGPHGARNAFMARCMVLRIAQARHDLKKERVGAVVSVQEAVLSVWVRYGQAHGECREVVVSGNEPLVSSNQ